MNENDFSRVKMLEEFLEDEPDDNFTRYALALEYSKLNQTGVSISHLEKILSCDEKYLPAYYQLGKLYEQMNRKEDAEKIYSKGILLAKEKRDQHTLNELKTALDSMMGIEEDE